MATLVDDETGLVAMGCGVAVLAGTSVVGISVGVGGGCVAVGVIRVGDGWDVGVAEGGDCVAVAGTEVGVSLAERGVWVLLSKPQRASSMLAAVAPAICRK
jgi:hypothetical protein